MFSGERLVRFTAVSQFQDQFNSGDREWVEFTNPGSLPERHSIDTIADEAYRMEPNSVVGTYPHYGPDTRDADIPTLSLISSKLGNPVFSLEMYVPKSGYTWLFIDAEFWMQYWQENVSHFEYGAPWVFEISTTNYVRPVGEWIVTSLLSYTRHANILARHLVRVLQPTMVDLTVAIRCGTATPKGQVMFASFRCEFMITSQRFKAIEPGVKLREDDEVCAVNDESGHVEDFDNSHEEPFVLV